MYSLSGGKGKTHVQIIHLLFDNLQLSPYRSQVVKVRKFILKPVKRILEETMYGALLLAIKKATHH